MDIWLPPSYRYAGAKEAQKAVQEYDPNLDFGFNEKTQQWCVFLKRGTMEASKHHDLPILGFDHIPGRDEVQKRLYESDAFRRGNEIVDQMQRENDALRVDHSDVDGNVAEYLEWGMRKMGSDKAPTRVFLKGN